MNKIRRRELEQAKQILKDAKEIIESVYKEEEEAFDNLPENLQDSSKGDTMEDNVFEMEDAIENIDEAIDHLENIE